MDILVVGPQFFGYVELISNQFIKKGFNSTFFDERASLNNFSKVIVRLQVPFFSKMIISFQRKKLLQKIINLQPSHILFISSEIADKDFINKIKKTLPGAKLTHYVWDSLASKPSVRNSIHCNWDNLLFFDLFDSKTYNSPNLILFYEPLFKAENNKISFKKQYDVVNISSFHSDRISVMKRFVKLNKNLKLKFILYCPTFFHFLIALIRLQGIVYENNIKITRKKISKKEISDLFVRSNSILDITHPNQRGLTSRTSEALASKRVLLTTNFSLPFYISTPNAIIIDRNYPEIPFIPKYKKHKEEILSISEWVDKILNFMQI